MSLNKPFICSTLSIYHSLHTSFYKRKKLKIDLIWLYFPMDWQFHCRYQVSLTDFDIYPNIVWPSVMLSVLVISNLNGNEPAFLSLLRDSLISLQLWSTLAFTFFKETFKIVFPQLYLKYLTESRWVL